jgi:hypothetical protein
MRIYRRQMVRDKRRARAHARLIYALAQADSEDDFARWSASYAKQRHHYGVTLRAARDLLATLGEILESMDEELGAERIALALKALEGAPLGAREAPAAEAAPAPAQPAVAVAALPPTDVLLTPPLVSPLQRSPSSQPEETSPWARPSPPALPVVALDANDALGQTANAVVVSGGSPLPFSGAKQAPPPAKQTEPNRDKGFTMDLAAGPAPGGEDAELAAYARACAMREASAPGSAHSPTAAADEKWGERFKANFPLFRRFKKLLDQYRTELAQSSRS